MSLSPAPASIKDTHPNDPPDFALLLWQKKDDPDEFDTIVQVPLIPSPDKPASAALLTGLAVLVLSQQGLVEATVKQLVDGGPISETRAIEMAELLLRRDDNDLPV